jgi:aminoglycoside phosphotransferase (APT) family kinase protein
LREAMSTAKGMHEGEATTNEALVARLLAVQFPSWAQLPIAPLRSSGTDHAMYRLGEHRVVRLPRTCAAAAQVEKEQRFLPRLAPALPLATPAPLALGAPAEGYPHAWSVYRWLEGEEATLERLDDLHDAAQTLADFILALRRVDATEGPAPGLHNSFRGVPLASRDPAVRAALEALQGTLDVAAARAAWEAALGVPAWAGAPVWIHGDLQSSNLLAVAGRLSAVIDFGCAGVGDPACDLSVGWNLLGPAARATFRARLAVDDAEWARGRGWALSIGLIALPYYEATNPVFAAVARRTVAEVLADPRP